MNLPHFWSRMGWTEKAAYLCRTHQAKDYSDACAKLRAMRKPSPRPNQGARPVQTFWWNK